MASTSYVVGQLSRYGDVQQDGRGKYWLQHSGYTVSVIDQAGEALCIRVRHSSDKDDLLTDYFAGSYFSSIKKALKYVGW